VDQNGASEAPGIYVCGNALHVNDLVDYVSESGEAAGAAAAERALSSGAASAERKPVPVRVGPGFLYAVPQFVDIASRGRAVLNFRSAATHRDGGRVRLSAGGTVLYDRRHAALRPPEMERIELDAARIPAGAEAIELALELEPPTGAKEAIHG
jgi:hypothetical protein